MNNHNIIGTALGQEVSAGGFSTFFGLFFGYFSLFTGFHSRFEKHIIFSIFINFLNKVLN